MPCLGAFRIVRALSAAVWLLFGTIGCGVFIPVSEGVDVSSRSVADLKLGSATQDEIRALLGEPTDAGTNTWTYSGQRMWMGVVTATDASFEFDDRGVVKAFEYTKMRARLLPFEMGRRLRRRVVEKWQPGWTTLDQVRQEAGDPTMIEASVAETSLAYVFSSLTRTTSTVVTASPEGTVRSVIHIDSPVRVSLLSRRVSTGTALGFDRIRHLAPGKTTFAQMTKRLGEPTILSMGPGRRHWIYFHMEATFEADDISPAWLHVLFDDEVLASMEWSSGRQSALDERPDLRQELLQMRSRDSVGKDECSAHLGHPVGLIRAPHCEQWVYVIEGESGVHSYLVRFSRAGEVSEVEERKDVNWLESAAKEYLPEETDLSTSPGR